ncbi:MAG: hypothetical protein KDD70_11725 [Bdellovibrionales bacterium]|nr:hypothetical protein [Bdellovibrionales bacterium]
MLTPDGRRPDVQPFNFEDYLHSLEEMRHEIAVLNSDPMIVRNGFQYPEAWLDAHRAAIEEARSNGIQPDIRQIGYGSLGTLAGRSSTESLKEVEERLVVTDCSQVFDGKRHQLVRSIDMAGMARLLKGVKNEGIEHLSLENLGTAAVRAETIDANTPYHPSREVVAALLGTNSQQQLEDFRNREWSYRPLPGPMVRDLKDPSKVFELTIICWPMGRSLIDNGIPQVDGTVDSAARTALEKKISSIQLPPEKNPLGLTGQEILSLYLAHKAGNFDDAFSHQAGKHPIAPESYPLTKHDLQKLFTVIDCCYDLDKRPEVGPNRGYVFKACLAFGAADPEYLDRFLRTTEYFEDGVKKPLLELAKEMNRVISFLPEVASDFYQQMTGLGEDFGEDFRDEYLGDQTAAEQTEKRTLASLRALRSRIQQIARNSPHE